MTKHIYEGSMEERFKSHFNILSKSYFYIYFLNPWGFTIQKNDNNTRQNTILHL